MSLSKEETRMVDTFMDLHSMQDFGLLPNLYIDTSLMLSFLMNIVPLVYHLRQGDEGTFKI